MSRSLVSVTLVAAAFGVCGCVDASKPPPYHFVEPIHARAILLETVVRPNQELRSKNFQRLQVRFHQTGRSLFYDVLIGPYPYNVTPPAVVPDAVAKYVNAIPRFILMDGWICMAGECPYVEAELVDATAHGSNATIVTQVDGTIERVFLLRRTGNEWATVTLKGQPVNPDTQKIWRADVDRYVEAFPGTPPTLSNPLPVASAPPAIREFVNDMNTFMSEAGMVDAKPLP